MKEATRAPFYACLYPGLCDIAQRHGYCLAIHGSVSRDLDLVAIPWVEEAQAPEILVKALMDHMGALLYPDKLRADGLPENHIKQILQRPESGHDPKAKPHGRLCWSLHLDFGSYVDLSVLPRSPAAPMGG